MKVLHFARNRCCNLCRQQCQKLLRHCDWTVKKYVWSIYEVGRVCRYTFLNFEAMLHILKHCCHLLTTALRLCFSMLHIAAGHLLATILLAGEKSCHSLSFAAINFRRCSLVELTCDFYENCDWKILVFCFVLSNTSMYWYVFFSFTWRITKCLWSIIFVRPCRLPLFWTCKENILKFD